MQHDFAFAHQRAVEFLQPGDALALPDALQAAVDARRQAVQPVAQRPVATHGQAAAGLQQRDHFTLAVQRQDTEQMVVVEEELRRVGVPRQLRSGAGDLLWRGCGLRCDGKPRVRRLRALQHGYGVHSGLFDRGRADRGKKCHGVAGHRAELVGRGECGVLPCLLSGKGAGDLGAGAPV